MFKAKCNCGREGRYSHFSPTGDMQVSCNKYTVCKRYAELEKELENTKQELLELLEAANDLRVFREGTGYYKDAEAVVLKYKSQYGQ